MRDVRETGSGLPVGMQIFDLELDRVFAAWRVVSNDARSYTRARRDKSSRLWLGTRSCTQFLWNLVLSLRCLKDEPLPAKLLRGIRCRHNVSQRAGTLLSSSEKGICKVLFDGDSEPAFVATAQLLRISIMPHPFLAGLAFLAWALTHAHTEDLKIDSLRTSLMFNHIMGKSAGKLTMLAVIQEEAAKGLRFCFVAWRRAVKSKSLTKFRLKRQKEVFRAWLEILLMEGHDKALEFLEAAQARLDAV